MSMSIPPRKLEEIAETLRVWQGEARANLRKIQLPPAICHVHGTLCMFVHKQDIVGYEGNDTRQIHVTILGIQNKSKVYSGLAAQL